jgi:hypothetical protein
MTRDVIYIILGQRHLLLALVYVIEAVAPSQ